MEQILLQILREKGLRMSNLAAKLGMDQSNLSKKLKKDLKVSLLENIASALEVPVSVFFPDQLPAAPAGVLDMGGKRFALVPFPDEMREEHGTPPEAYNLTPESFQERICILARQCSKDRRTRAVFGFLSGHPTVVLYDNASNRYLRLMWEDDGEVTHLDYPLSIFDDEEQLAELIVNDILGSHDL